MLVLKVLVVVMAMASCVSVANGQCCPYCPPSGRCADGTSCTPLFNCCATGPCNIACCSCQGVCREGKIAADNLDVAIERFSQFDTDKNGAIDIHELKQADVGAPAYIQESTFGRIDVNRDGKITIEEFDEDAGRSIKEKLQLAAAN